MTRWQIPTLQPRQAMKRHASFMLESLVLIGMTGVHPVSCTAANDVQSMVMQVDRSMHSLDKSGMIQLPRCDQG